MALIKKCCCCSLKTGILVLGALLLIGSILAMGRDIKDVYEGPSYSQSGRNLDNFFAQDLYYMSIGDLVLSIAMIIFSSLLLYGANKGIARYVKPILVMIPIDFIVRVSLLVLTSQYAYFAYPLSFAMNMTCVIGMVFDAFTWLFIYSHYKQLSDEGEGGTDSEMRPMK